MKQSRFSLDFSVGFVLFVATILVIMGIFMVGSGTGILGSYADYRIRFPNTVGLIKGSRVYLSGVHVGAVGTISFPEDLAVGQVEVDIHVDERYMPRIREDSYAWLQNEGLLGDVSIHIKMGTAEKAECVPGSYLPSKKRPALDDLVGEEIRAGTTDLLQQIIAVLEEVNRGEGTIGQLLKNPDLYKNLSALSLSMDGAVRQLTAITSELEGMLAEVRTQKGTLGKLVFSPEYAENFTTLLQETSELAGNLREITTRVKDGKGAIGKLLTDPAAHDVGIRTLEDVGTLAARLDRVLTEAERSRSILGRIATDGQTGQDFTQLLARLDRSAASLEQILATIERGEGSVGMLVRDPSLFASMRNVFLGVSEGGVVQNIVRSAERSGREAYLREVALDSAEAAEIRKARALLEVGRSSGSPGNAVQPVVGPGPRPSPLEPSAPEGGTKTEGPAPASGPDTGPVSVPPDGSGQEDESRSQGEQATGGAGHDRG